MKEEDYKMKTLKKIAAVVATLALTVGMSASCFAATWHGYFGVNEAWFEGAEGQLTENTETGWTADMKTIGWGGCWGAQVDQKVSIKKGQEYVIKATLTSSKCDKWVFIKISKGDSFAYGKWIRLKKGQATTLEETFTAKSDADQITFGLGGEFGDRVGSDNDAEKRYAFAGGSEKLKADSDVDPTFSTVVTCKDFYLGEPQTEANNNGNGPDAPKETTAAPTGTVATGDFKPIALGAAAVIAAATIVVFARKRETE